MSLIRKNIFWLLASQGATWIATLATLLIVPNKLGSTDFGTFGFATGYVQFFTLVAGLGTSIFLSRAIARDHELLGPYVWNAVLLKIALWLVLSAAALGLAVLLGNTGETLVIIAISCVGMLPFLLTEVFVGALAGLQQMARPAMWVVAQVYFQTILGITVLLLGWGVIAYTVVMTLGAFIPAIATAVMVHPLLRGHRAFQLQIWRLLVWGGVPLVALNFLTLIYGSVDVPILHSIVGSDPVGWYVVALRWASIPVFMPTAIVGAYFPLFAKHGNPVTPEFAPLVNRANHIVLLVMIPASVGLFLTAEPLVELLYDQSYDSAIPLVKILAVGIPIMGMDTVLTTALVASDRLARYLWFAAAAAVLNPTLCLVAVRVSDSRWDNGAIGAAAVTVATELFVMVGALLMRSPGILDRAEIGRIARIVAASALMVPVLLVASGLPLPVLVLLGVASYAVGSLVFGSFSLGEARDVIKQVKDSRRGAATSDDEFGPVEDDIMVPPMTPGPDEPPML